MLVLGAGLALCAATVFCERNVMPKKPEDKVPTGTDPMLQFFVHKHLPEHLALVSKPFCTLAEGMVENLPRNPERSAMLRKLLEAKDCAVRALLYKG